MSDEKKRNLDCYLKNISTNNVVPLKLIKGIRGAGDSKRADAFPESPTPLNERRDARK
jgi:hypothetical protein